MGLFIDILSHLLAAGAGIAAMVGIYTWHNRTRFSTNQKPDAPAQNGSKKAALIFYIVPLGISVLIFFGVAFIIWAVGFNVWDETFWRDPDKAGGGAEAIRNFVFAVGALAAIPVGLLTLGNAIRRSKAMDTGALTGDLRLQTETYSKSVELLGSAQFAQILGGIYSLERLAIETRNQDFLEQIQSTFVSFLHAVPENFSEIETKRIKEAIIEVLDRSFSNRSRREISLGESCNLPNFVSFECGSAGLKIDNTQSKLFVNGYGGSLDVSFKGDGSASINGEFSAVYADILGTESRPLNIGAFGGRETTINTLWTGPVSSLTLNGTVSVQKFFRIQIEKLVAVNADMDPSDILKWAEHLKDPVDTSTSSGNLALPSEWSKNQLSEFDALLKQSEISQA